MDVLVVGGSGRTGRLLTSGALERAPQKLGDLAGHVRVVAGDVLDDGPARGDSGPSRAAHSPAAGRIARADIAEYMLDQLTITGDTSHGVAVAY
jgi:hypothetical protein